MSHSGENCNGVKGYFTAEHLGRSWICTDPNCELNQREPFGECCGAVPCQWEGKCPAAQIGTPAPSGRNGMEALLDAVFKHSFDATHALAALESENMKLRECVQESQAALRACAYAAHDEKVLDFGPVSNAADAALACVHKWELP